MGSCRPSLGVTATSSAPACPTAGRDGTSRAAHSLTPGARLAGHGVRHVRALHYSRTRGGRHSPAIASLEGRLQHLETTHAPRKLAAALASTVVTTNLSG